MEKCSSWKENINTFSEPYLTHVSSCCIKSQSSNVWMCRFSLTIMLLNYQKPFSKHGHLRMVLVTAWMECLLTKQQVLKKTHYCTVRKTQSSCVKMFATDLSDNVCHHTQGGSHTHNYPTLVCRCHRWHKDFPRTGVLNLPHWLRQLCQCLLGLCGRSVSAEGMKVTEKQIKTWNHFLSHR